MILSSLLIEFSIVRDNVLKIGITGDPLNDGLGTSDEIKGLAKELVEFLNCSVIKEYKHRIANSISLELDYPIPASMKIGYWNLKKSESYNSPLFPNSKEDIDKRFKFERWTRNIKRAQIAKKFKALK